MQSPPDPNPRPDAQQRKILGFLLFFVAVGAMPPTALYWDGIGFLTLATGTETKLDYGHTLYIPLLQLWHGAVNAVWSGSWEFCSKILSSLGAAVFFVALWSRIERVGLRPVTAFSIAAVGATTPLFWRQAGIIEPTTWMLAALLFAASAAERYGAERTLARGMAFVIATLVLLGFHLVAIFALPWLAWLARGPAARPPARHAFVFAGLAACGALALAAAGKLDDVRAFTGYWAGFLPAFGLESGREHAYVAWQILTRGLPGPLVAGVLGLTMVLCTRRRVCDAWVLGVPYLAAFVVLGQPRVGLLIPVGVALTLCAAEGIASLSRGRIQQVTVRFALPLLLAFQVGQGMSTGLTRAMTPDDLQEQAELMAAALPRSSILLSGTVAHHVHWVTNAPVVALSNELQGAYTAGLATVDEDGTTIASENARAVIADIHAIAARELANHDRVYISSEAIEWLRWRFGVDPSLLHVDRSGMIVARQDPLLYLVPMVPEAFSLDAHTAAGADAGTGPD